MYYIVIIKTYVKRKKQLAYVNISRGAENLDRHLYRNRAVYPTLIAIKAL